MLLLTFCAIAAAADPAYLYEIRSEEDLAAVSVPDHSRPDILSVTKYLAPATASPALLRTVYQNVNRYQFHLTFMATEFPDRFAGLTPAEYRALIEVRATRQYFAGAVYKLEADAAIVYGFDLYTDPAAPAELPTIGEVQWIFNRLRETFSMRPVAYAPTRPDMISQARKWEDAPFPIYFPQQGVIGTYRAYVTGVAYGRVRAFTLAELLAASDAGALSWQDVVVVDSAPPDLAAPIGAILTGSAQTELSHLSLRMSQRGTPNAYDAKAMERFAPLAGSLVKIEVTEVEATASAVADPAEAERWWATHQSRLPRLPGFDLAPVELAELEELGALPDAALAYGAKAANLAYLRAALGPAETAPGFAIPFSWYERFMAQNYLIDPRNGRLVSYATYLAGFLADDAFRTDAVRRSYALNWFIERAEEESAVPGEYVRAIAARTEAVFGGAAVMVRCRSSSNYEDIVPFNGAGLYESTSACAADSLDRDAEGPSICDPDEPSERTIERALRHVWLSLWLPRAYSERDFWQAPHDRAKMGILVTPRYEDEAANGVILTGNPAAAGDNRFVINAQLGETSVVTPPEGVLPEKLVVTMDAAGSVAEIVRARPSSIVPPGGQVLSDGEARRLAELAWQAQEALKPRFADSPGEILFDLEFKVGGGDGEADRAVVLKQIRPFLRSEVEGGTLGLVVPAGTMVRGVHIDGRTLGEEYARLASARLVPGRLELPAREGSFQGELLEELLVGPKKVKAVPVGPGTFTCESGVDGTKTTYVYRFEQTYAVGDATARLVAGGLSYWVGEDGTASRELVLDEFYLTYRLSMALLFGEEPSAQRIRFGSSTHELLPLFEAIAIAPSGEVATVRVRRDPLGPEPDPGAGGAPAGVASGLVTLGGVTREVTDYWKLVYSADGESRRYWIVLDPAITYEPFGPISFVEVREPAEGSPAHVALLDASGTVLTSFDNLIWQHIRVQDPEHPEFRRGDANGDGRVDVADAVSVLAWVFRGAGPLTCHDAADANDDGALNVADPIRLLLYLFRPDADPTKELPWPGATRCGKDLTNDELPACAYDVARC